MNAQIQQNQNNKNEQKFREINKTAPLISVDHQTNCDHKISERRRNCAIFISLPLSLFVCCLTNRIKTKTNNIIKCFYKRAHKPASKQKAWILIASSNVLQVIHLNIFKQNMTTHTHTCFRALASSKLNRRKRVHLTIIHRKNRRLNKFVDYPSKMF